MMTRRWVFLLLAVGVGSPCAWGAEGDGTIDAMLARWKERPVDAVYYSLEGKRTVLQGDFPGIVLEAPAGVERAVLIDPPADVDYAVAFEIVLDFKGGRLRMDERAKDYHLDERIFRKCREIHLFDGESYQRYSPRADNESLLLEKYRFATELHINLDPNSSALFHQRHYAPLAIFLSLGILPGDDGQFPEPSRLVPRVDRDAFQLVDERSREEEKCTVVAMPFGDAGNSYEYWVSQERPGKIVRCDSKRGDTIRWRLDLWYDGKELARTVRWKLNTEQELELVDDFRVKKLLVDPPLDNVVFHIEPTVGMVYNDHKLDERFLIEREGEPARDVKTIYAEEMKRKGKR